MYVCVCKAISEKRIRRAAAEGVISLRDLQHETGLGTVCGKCVPSARACLNEAAHAQMHRHITLKPMSMGAVA